MLEDISQLGTLGIVIAAIVFGLKLANFVEGWLKKRYFNGTTRDRRNGNEASAGNPSMGITTDQMADMYRYVDKLYEWHDTDDPETGQKRWLLMPQILAELKLITKAIGGLAKEIQEGHGRLRETLKEQTEVVSKNTLTVETLKEKIAKFFK